MENNLCKVCGAERKKIFSKIILGKYDVSYFECPECGFVQTEKPYWLKESYSSVITSTDVGMIKRNIMFSDIVERVIYGSFDEHGKFLDFAGGYGMFTRIMRDKGFDFYHEDKYCENLFANNFSVNDLAKEERRFDLVTAFEMIEHADYPFRELEYIFSISDDFLFSTELIPRRDFENWWYLGTEHGQHISFYTPKSLEIIAKKYGKYYYPHGNLHLFSSKDNLDAFDNVGEEIEASRKLNSRTESDFEMVRNKIKQL
jgi:hypothetical protein